MDLLIDSSYFVGEINIAQLGQIDVQEQVDSFIAKYHFRYLRNVLGYAFSKLFEDGYNPANDDRWKKIVDGDDYTDAKEVTRHWAGLIDSDLPYSPIANYVYYFYNTDLQSVSTISGEQEMKHQGAMNTAAAQKLSRAWNEMVDANLALVDFLLNKKTDGNRVYPEFTFEPCGLDRQQANMFHKINQFNL